MTNEAKTSNSTDPMYWFNLAVENFIIQGKSKRTAETYAREIKILVRYYKKPLNKITEDEIRKFVVYRKVECELHPMSRSSVQNSLKDAARAANIKPEKVRPHVLRHYPEFRIMPSSA